MQYWRDEIFCMMVTYFVPVGLIALVPGVYMSFHTGYLLVGVADLLAFASVILVISYPRIPIARRKFIFLAVFYILPIVFLFYIVVTGVGMLYLLGLTVITAIIYSPRAAYYSAMANTLICLCFALLFMFAPALFGRSGYTAGSWIAVSSNLVLLSFVFAACLNLQLRGLNDTIIDKLAAEQGMKQLTDRLLMATRSAGMGIWSWDIATDQLSWDHGMLELYQVGDHQLGSVYERWLSLIHPDDRDKTTTDIQNAIMGIKVYDTEFRIIWPDGSVHHIRATAILERDAAGKAERMIGANWDITDIKQQQEWLSISESNLAAIIESADANIYSLDRELRYITFNDSLRKSIQRIFNIDIKPGDKVFELSKGAAPHDAREWENIYTDALTGKPLKFEKQFDIGEKISTISFSINPIIKNGEVIGLSCFVVDISDLRNALTEIQNLNQDLELKVQERTAELENANKELESFSYSVSHDLRAPVRAILGFAKIIREEYPHDLHHDARQMFSYIEASSHRMNAIIDDLYVLAKYGREKLVYAEVDLGALFRDTWGSLQLTSPHLAALDLQPLPRVRADASMLQQVVVNLLSNAIKYSAKKDQPLIKVGAIPRDGSVTIYVRDNGAGFDMKYYDRLFGAFQRLHGISEFEGTGLGLMLTKKIIERHNGEVWAEGKVGEGASFYFSLPSAAYVFL
jgi:signal transduction histidine kinase